MGMSGLCVYCRYNKQVLKVFPYPVTCTTVQVWQTDQLLLYYLSACLQFDLPGLVPVYSLQLGPFLPCSCGQWAC